MHPDGACPGSRWVRFCDFASLADRIDPNDYRPPMACLSLQALTISDPLKAGLVVTNGRAHTTLGEPAAIVALGVAQLRKVSAPCAVGVLTCLMR